MDTQLTAAALVTDAEKLRGMADKLEALLADPPTPQSYAGRECLGRAEIEIGALIKNIRTDAEKLGGWAITHRF